MHAGSRILWVHSLYAGVESVARQMRSLDAIVPLTNAKGVFSSSLAEYTLACMLHFTKQLSRLEHNRRNKIWDKFVMGTLAGRTVGLLGYGDIAQKVASVCSPLGLRIVAFKRQVCPLSGQVIIPDKLWTSLDDLPSFLGESDFVVCSLPSTDATYHFCDARFFSSMKPSSVFISIGRGSCVNEKALARSLQLGHISGAALDVFETEPLPNTSDLWNCENCIISSHNADWTGNNLIDSTKTFLRNLDRFIHGLPLDNLVDRERGY